MRKFFKENFEKIKLVAIVLFCLSVGSGGAKNLFNNHSGKDEITLSFHEELATIEEPKEYVEIESSTTVNPEIENEEVSHKININSADSQALQNLLGIGPVKAESIIHYRNAYGGFTSIEEITEVKGIGNATYGKIKDYITIE